MNEMNRLPSTMATARGSTSRHYCQTVAKIEILLRGSSARHAASEKKSVRKNQREK
jgi:hypothetical protein